MYYRTETLGMLVRPAVGLAMMSAMWAAPDRRFRGFDAFIEEDRELMARILDNGRKFG